MYDIKIEKNILPPPLPFDYKAASAVVCKMEVNDSIAVDANQASKWLICFRRLKFGLTTQTEGEKHRIWRTA